MTIREAIRLGVRRVRMPSWNSQAYLELPSDGGVWATLYDPPSQNALGIPVGSQRMLVSNIDNDCSYEPFPAPPEESKAADSIRTMSLAELASDRAASVADIEICGAALRLGVRFHRDGLSVEQRLKTNRDIIETIDAEILRRETAAAELVLACSCLSSEVVQMAIGLYASPMQSDNQLGRDWERLALRCVRAASNVEHTGSTAETMRLLNSAATMHAALDQLGREVYRFKTEHHKSTLEIIENAKQEGPGSPWISAEQKPSKYNSGSLVLWIVGGQLHDGEDYFDVGCYNHTTYQWTVSGGPEGNPEDEPVDVLCWFRPSPPAIAKGGV